MTHEIHGIHHVTAIASGAQQNVDFYAGILGMRLVKRTINYDDPGTHHLYYGDGLGRPGTLLTFFPYENAYQGVTGSGQATSVALAVPQGSLEFWINRFAEMAVGFDGPWERFGEHGITVRDYDGLQIELIETNEVDNTQGWSQSDVPSEHAIRGIHSVLLTERSTEGVLSLLERKMGYSETEREQERIRLQNGSGIGSFLEVVEAPDLQPGRVAAGSVHHVAFRVENDEAQEEWREELVKLGFAVSPIMDRDYFQSIYFREPGGVLFEIATDPPGMTIDETIEELGSDLRYPKWLKVERDEMLRRLPPITVPAVTR